MRFALLLSVLALTGGCAANMQASQARFTSLERDIMAHCSAYADRATVGYQNADTAKTEHRRIFEQCLRATLR